MNLFQAAQQAKWLLKRATWAANVPVFRPESVVICGDLPDDFMSRISTPCALIRVQGASCDEEEADLFKQMLEVTIGVVVPNDAFGESAFLGANRGQLASEGMGVLQIEEKLIATLSGPTDANGVHFLIKGKGAAPGTAVSNLKYAAWRTYQFEASVTGTRFYHPPTRFAGTGGSGQVAMTWKLPPSRFDSPWDASYTPRVVLRRAAGSTAPATATDGTGVTLTGSPAGTGIVSKTDSGLSPGIYSYSLFAAYDEYGSSAITAGNIERYSAPATITKTAT